MTESMQKPSQYYAFQPPEIRARAEAHLARLLCAATEMEKTAFHEVGSKMEALWNALGVPELLGPYLTHPEAQGNKDLGEPQTSFAWQKIESAPKDGTRVLLQLKSPIPNDRPDLRRWDGIPFIGRHNGYDTAKHDFDMGWQFAAPVGHGGFPDEWMGGWAPLPPPPSERSEAAPTSPQPIKGDKTEALTDAATLQALEGL